MPSCEAIVYFSSLASTRLFGFVDWEDYLSQPYGFLLLDWEDKLSQAYVCTVFMFCTVLSLSPYRFLTVTSYKFMFLYNYVFFFFLLLFFICIFSFLLPWSVMWGAG